MAPREAPRRALRGDPRSAGRADAHPRGPRCLSPARPRGAPSLPAARCPRMPRPRSRPGASSTRPHTAAAPPGRAWSGHPVRSDWSPGHVLRLLALRACQLDHRRARLAAPLPDGRRRGSRAPEHPPWPPPDQPPAVAHGCQASACDHSVTQMPMLDHVIQNVVGRARVDGRSGKPWPGWCPYLSLRQLEAHRRETRAP